MLKKILQIALVLLPLIACETTHQKHIAITQIVDHPSLNQAKIGILDTLPKGKYKITQQDAQGDVSIARQIASRYISMKPDLIVAISTTSAQAFKNTASHNIPIIFSSVTDGSVVVKKSQKPEGNITGVTDYPPLKELLVLMQKMIPNLKSIGVIYNSGEINSHNIVQKLKQKNLNIIEAPVTSAQDVISAVQLLAGKVDTIYVPSDNTVWPALEALTKKAAELKIPVFSSDPDSVKKGVTVALGYGQYDLGVAVAHQIVQILEKGRKIQDIPVQTPAKQYLVGNPERLAMLKLKLPEVST